MTRGLFRRRLGLTVAALLLASLTPADAQAPAPGMCCVHSTSKLDALMNPVVGGDEKFFRSSAGTPNVLLVLDSSQRMRGWAKPWPTTPGCAHAEINDLGYDPARYYPPMWQNYNSLNTNWFDNTTTYQIAPNGYGVRFNNDPTHSGNSGLSSFTSVANACATATSNFNPALTAAESSQCQSCVSTRGYWVRGPDANDVAVGRVAGNFLNFYGPRDSGSNAVLNRLVRDLGGYRFASVGLSMSGAGQKCWVSGQGSIGFICSVFDFRSCTSTTTPSSAITQINSIEWWPTTNATNNALLAEPAGASVLYAAASRVRSATPDAYTAANGGMFPGCVGCTNANLTETSSSPGMCADCEFAAVIYISAGAGNAPNPLITLPAEILAQDVACNGCNPNDLNLPKVAKWFWDNDSRIDAAFPSRNRIATYTIGMMDPSVGLQDETLLKRTARVGGGKYYRATSTVGLQEAIFQALDDISSRPTQFSSASLASVQTSTGDLAAILPRLAPQADTPWIGELYRFRQFNEFVEDVDFDGANGKNDVFLLDQAGQIVQENAQGELVQRDNPTQKAEPYWEARTRLKADGYDSRNIWTVLDTNTDGRFTQSDGLQAVRTEDHAALAPYLGILGTGHCPSASEASLGRMIEKFGFGTVFDAAAALPDAIRPDLGTNPSQALLDELCVKLLIQYVRGQDLADENANDDRTETRDSVLGDIFHSSPVIVDPPVDRFLCDMGLHTQCVRTLYASTEALGVNATPSGSTTYPDQTALGCTVKIRAAYDLYKHQQRKRDKLVLVGSNGGMVHAFHAGSVPIDGETCDAGLLNVTYDFGTGQEKWAFIPPDQLPRLIDAVYDHQYMVDGDIMVRDIWADGSGAVTTKDGKKQADEFKTVAIVGEGRGGIHTFALQIPFEDDGTTASDRPRFLWMFPQPCSEEAALFGKSLLSFSPRPPPMGPVLIDVENTNDAPIGVVTSGGEVPRYERDTVERWVAWISGGWSPGREKGRGIYMVDAWWGNLRDEGGITGARQDNLWWKFEFDPTASGEQNEPRRHLTASIVAPVAMIDYGANNEIKRDGFFDTGIVGDTAGQVWTVRHHRPGRLDPSTGLVANWAGARTFQMDRAGGASVANRAPFHFLASSGLQPTTGALRVMLGAGDRYDLLADQAGSCQFDNPVACAKYGCSDVRVRYSLTKTGLRVDAAENRWQGRNLTTADVTAVGVSPARDACGSPHALGTASAPVLASYGVYQTGTCANLVNPVSPWPAALNQVSANCGRDGEGNFRCEKTGTPVLKRLGDPNATALANLGNNRYFGLWAYGGDRIFDEDLTTSTLGKMTAREFDALRLSDRTTATTGDLVDVTGNVITAGESSRGWFYQYSALNRKTASAGTLIAGCALWNAVFPSPPAASQCPDNRQAQKMLFLADFITGGTGCAPGFGTGRFVQTHASAPPPEPVSIVQVSKTGKIRRSGLVGDGIQFQPITVTETNDVLQSLYEVPVTRSIHQCRHVDPGTAGTCDLGGQQQLLLAP
jgi:type IV pilus assembly protein PilY1